MLIIIGGESRKCGKTTLVCRILRRFPDRDWLAVKTTPHAHEPHLTGGDTQRFSDAGAREVLLLVGDHHGVLPRLREALARHENACVEGNVPFALFPHAVRLMVRTADPAEAKPGSDDETFRPGVYVGERRDGETGLVFAPEDPALLDFLAERWKHE